MPGYAQTRDNIVTQLESWPNKSTVPLVYENTTEVDLAKAPDHFIRVKVLFDDHAEQADIGESPLMRFYGTLVLTLVAKEGEGKRKSLQYFDELASLMKFKNLGGVQMKAAAPGREASLGSHFTMDLRIPFYADA